MPESALLEKALPVEKPATSGIADLLIRRATKQPDKPAYVFIGNRSVPDEVLTWRTVLARSAGVASLLEERRLRGARVLLSFRSNASFVVTLLGALLAGAIAVPLPPRNGPSRTGRHALIGLKRGDVAWIADDELDDAHTLEARAAAWSPAKLAAETPAILQYTSGCTGMPKGVLLTHGQLLANSEAIRCGFETTPQTIGLIPGAVSQDMGVIGGILQPLYTGCCVHLMEPSAFDADPVRWLELIDQRRATVSGGTVAMYERLLRAVEDRGDLRLDLSCWRTAFIGADLVPVGTLKRLGDALAPHGFDAAAITPCYGLAEAALMVTAGRYRPQSTSISAGLSGAPDLVCCGTPITPTQIRVVDPVRRREVADGEEGEIWVSGPAVSARYWRDAQRTRASLRARLSTDAQTVYLRTGDLGFMRDGRVYPSGRVSDLLCMTGRKVRANLVERAAESGHASVVPGGAVAFTAKRAGRSQLVLALELKPEGAARQEELWFIGQVVRDALRIQGIEVDEVVLLRAGGLPRSPGGKVQRSRCKSEYEHGTLAALM